MKPSLALAVAVSLAAGPATAAAASTASPMQTGPAATGKARVHHVQAALAAPTSDAGRALAEAAAAGRTKTLATAAPPPLAATAGELDCSAFGGSSYVVLTDRVVFRIADAGAKAVTIDRANDRGARIRVVTGLSGATPEYADRTVPKGTWRTYFVTFSFADGTSRTCELGEQPPRSDWVLGDFDRLWAGPSPERGSLLAARNTSSPAFSADGRWLGYTAFTGTGDGLYIRRADGSGVGSPLPSTSGSDSELAFSFDGRWAAYTSMDVDSPELTSHLQLVDLTTRTQRALPGSTDLGQPAWTRDGRIIATDYASDTAPLVYVSPSTGRTTATLPGSAGGYSAETGVDGTIIYSAPAADWSHEELRAVRGSSTKVLDSLPENAFVLAARIDPSDRDMVWMLVGWVVFDPATGEATDFRTEMRYVSVVNDGGSQGTWGTDTAELVTSLDVRAPLSVGTSDYTGDRQNDVLARDASGVLWVYPGARLNQESTLGSRIRVGAGWNTMTVFAAAGDLNGDGVGDVVARDRDGVLWAYPGTGRPSPVLGARARLSGGWNGYAVVAGGDYNGDLRADVLARDSAGNLWLYPGTGTGGAGRPGLGARTLVGGGWNIMKAIVPVGDATYDGRPDIVATDRETDITWLYRGLGNGKLGSRTRIAQGMQATAYLAVENHVEEDAPVTLAVRYPDGYTLAQEFFGDGTWSGQVWSLASNFNGYTLVG